MTLSLDLKSRFRLIFLSMLSMSTPLFAQSQLWEPLTKEQKYDVANIRFIESTRNDENGRFLKYIESKDPIILAHTLQSAARMRMSNSDKWANQSLKSNSDLVRLSALFALTLSPNANPQAWINVFSSLDHIKEKSALYNALAYKGGASEAEYLIKQLKNPNTAEKLQPVIFYALTQLSAKGISFVCPVDEIEKALFTTDNDLKASALSLLSAINDCPKKNEWALQSIQDENEDIRRLAFLSISGADAIAKTYQALSTDPSARVALASITLLSSKEGELILGKALNDFLAQIKAGTMISGSRLSVLNALLELALRRPYSAELRKLGQSFVDATKSSADDDENTALDKANVYCRASALLDSQKGEASHLLKCTQRTELKPLVEKLNLMLIEGQGSARKLKSLIKAYPNASLGLKISILKNLLSEKLPKEANAILKGALLEEHSELLKLAVQNVLTHKVSGLEQELLNLCTQANLRGQNEVLSSTIDALVEFDVKEATSLFTQFQTHPNADIRSKADAGLMKLNGSLASLGTKTLRPPPGEVNPPSVSWAEKSAYTQAVIETNRGNIEISFLSNESPQSIKRFVKLVEKDFYQDKTVCAQDLGQWLALGAPDNELYMSAETPILSEESPIPFERLVVGLFQNERDQGNGALVFALERQFSWDMKHTPFAYVTAGADILMGLQLGDKINKIELKKN